MTDEELYAFHQDVLRETDRTAYREGWSREPDIPDGPLSTLVTFASMPFALPIFLWLFLKGLWTNKPEETLPYYGDNHFGSPW